MVSCSKDGGTGNVLPQIARDRQMLASAEIPVAAGWPEARVIKIPGTNVYRMATAYVVVGSLWGIILWVAHRMRVRILSDRIRNLFAERLSERERNAREFDDVLLQGIQGLILLLEGVAVQIPPENPLASKLEAAISRTEQLVNEGRDRVRILQTSNRDLADALRGLNGDQRPRETRYSVKITGQERKLQLLVSDEVYEIARECIVNAFHDVSANHVWVTLVYRRTSVDLSVRDDGRAVGWAYAVDDGTEDLRLTRMQDSARRLEGSLEVLERTPNGTEVRLRIPAGIAYCPPASFVPNWWQATRNLFERKASRQ